MPEVDQSLNHPMKTILIAISLTVPKSAIAVTSGYVERTIRKRIDSILRAAQVEIADLNERLVIQPIACDLLRRAVLPRFDGPHQPGYCAAIHSSFQSLQTSGSGRAE
jgi:hypothetical protein